MRFLILFCCLVFPSQLLLADSKLKPVASSMLQGNKLVVEDSNFTVKTPTGDWQWFYFKKSKTTYGYILSNEESKERYLITINNKTYPSMTKMVAFAYFNNISKSYSSKGYKISNFKLNAVKKPVQSSYQLSYESTQPDGNINKTYTRLFTKQRLYMISYTTDDMGRAREKRFNNFVDGFKIIKE